MSAPFEDIEARLRAALAPVDPPKHLQERLELTLGELVELAADELEAWELQSIRDPRNWPRAAGRPAAALVVGSGACAPRPSGRAPRSPRPPPWSWAAPRPPASSCSGPTASATSAAPRRTARAIWPLVPSRTPRARRTSSSTN